MTAFNVFMLFVMLSLHYFWYFKFIQMVIYFKTTGKAEDLQNKIQKKK